MSLAFVLLAQIDKHDVGVAAQGDRFGRRHRPALLRNLVLVKTDMHVGCHRLGSPARDVSIINRLDCHRIFPPVGRDTVTMELAALY
jgi:hypothetical protein